MCFVKFQHQLQMLLLIFLISSWICCDSVSSGEVYIVSPMPKEQCQAAVDSCFTLSQFSHNTSSLQPVNTTMIFLTGNHSLDKSITFSNVRKVLLYSNNSFEYPRIYCERPNGLKFHNIESIYMLGLEFSGCFFKFFSAFHVLLETLIVNGVNNSQTAVEIVNSSVTVLKSVFRFNSFGKNQHDGYRVGGAIISTQSNLTILESLFKDNKAELGGAIYSEQDSSVTIANSTFVENRATCLRQGISCFGGVMCSHASTVTISCCIFQNNSAESDSNGGASNGGVLASFYSKIVVSNSTYEENSAKGSGGVIVSYFSSLKINTSKFSNNTAETGGIIRTESSDIISILNRYVHNTATAKGGVIYSIQSSILDTGSNLSENTAFYAGIMFAQHTNTSFTRCKIKHNKASEWFGGVACIEKGRIDFIESEVLENFAEVSGGVVDVNGASVNIHCCKFSNNSVRHYFGGILHAQQANIAVSKSILTNSMASKEGGAIMIENSNMAISDSRFINNTGSHGGAIHFYQNQWNYIINIRNTSFSNNSAAFDGGAVHGVSQAVIFRNSNFSSSYALQGGAIYTSGKTFIQMVDTRIYLNRANTGIVYMLDSIGKFAGSTDFLENLGSLFLHNSNVNITGHSKFISNTSPNNNITITEGGAITAFQSDVYLSGACYFMHNNASRGGAILAIKSKLFVEGETTIANNTAINTGGGLYLEQTELNCRSHSVLKLLQNSATANGGGIHSISSTVNVNYIVGSSNYLESSIYFIENRAKNGGGVFLEVNAKLYTLQRTTTSIFKSQHFTTFVFINNSADYGGAVYVADDTNFGVCASTSNSVSSTTTECFLQSLSLHDKTYHKPVFDTNFTNNFAHYSGSTLFGGLLDRCTVSPFAEAYTAIGDSITGLEYFHLITNVKESSVSSLPVRACFCVNNQPNCSYHLPVKQITKGEKFTVMLVAVDQVNKTVNNATIRSFLSSKLGGFGENQLNQTTSDGCTDLSFEIFSPHATEELMIYADGPCKDAKPSTRIVQVQFLPCTCPVGFQPKATEMTKCICDCDFAQLSKYITKCNIQNKSILREGSFWISFVNATKTSSSGFLIYPNCPLNYCHPPDSKIDINLNIVNGADVQCAHNRRGLLCGSCKYGYSLSLGSIRCISCPNYWSALVVVITSVALITGIGIVVTILALNLTVAVGTLNGIIFYANVVAAYNNTFSTSTPVSVLISWLNLDIGFNTCFFNGMDSYWKLWVQLLFPAYMIILVVMIIIISEKSKRFSEFIGKKNPVAALATLILLSYAKFLHVIIGALSSADLKYPGGKIVTVWLPDATIEYFRGRHIALFVVAFVILLFGIAYTLLLFSWQWLLYFSEKKFLKWVINNQKLAMFIETYNAPYTSKNRYWTGLLLIARIFLYVASTANVTGNPKIDLQVIGICIGSIIFLKEIITFKSRVYKKWPTELLEFTCYINLLFLCFASFYTLQNEMAKVAVVNISVSITFLLFLGVLVYHIFTELIVKLWKRCCESPTLAYSGRPLSNDGISGTVNSISTSTVKIESKTIGTIHNYELREPLIEAENEQI